MEEKQKYEHLNKKYPLWIATEHPNPIIRWQERQRQNILLDLACQSVTDDIVDVGCQTGELITEIEKTTGGRCYGVDIDDSITKSDECVTWLQGDVTNMPHIKTDLADVTVCASLIEHVKDVDAALNELVRITKPGGRLILSVPNEKFVLTIKSVLRATRLTCLIKGIHPYQAEGHVHVFNKELLRKHLKNKPVTIKKLFYNHPYYTKIFCQCQIKK